GTVTYSAWLERRLENPITSSPTAKSVTPEPSSLTTPARSLPCPDGNVAGKMSRTAPARMAASLMLIPAALTSTRTSPRAGTGRATSRTSRTSMPPYESNCTALLMKIAPILRPGPRLEVGDGELLCHAHFILQYFYERIPRWYNQQSKTCGA